MESEKLILPFSARVTIFFIGFIALIVILYVGKSIIVPLVFATIIAIMLNPVVRLLVKIRINRVVAITLALLITFLLLIAFAALVMSQLSRFSDSWPILVGKLNGIISGTITEAAEYFNKDPQKIYDWISKTQSDLVSISTAAIGQTLVIIGSAMVVLFLLPVYIFLILFYKPIIIEFILRLFGKEYHIKVKGILSQVKTVIQKYLFGLLIEAAMIAALDTLALLILGIEYALLLGIIGALLNMIPYIGGLVAVALPMIVALVTKSSPVFALYVMVAYYIIQLIDNNYIVPKIVASKVKINALFSIIVVIAGNALWGIPGMFLSIPLLAIVKLLFDHIESLKPWGFLLGDTMPGILKIKSVFRAKKTIN